MTYIIGVDIPRGKHVVASLTYIYGTGNITAKKILADAGISEDVRIRELADKQTDAIRVEVDKLKVGGGLRREVNLNIKRPMEIGSYRGICRRRGLPVRRQNTKNSICTHKGPARVIAGKKK